MTKEEKAKAYDEAIEKARSLHDNYNEVSTLIDIKEELEHIFPELRESEDGKMRKEIVGYLKKNLRYEWATWLEKQGTPYTKRDVDDAYVEGMAFAKDELKKQGQKSSWSKEDENVVEDIKEAVINTWGGDTQDIILDWLLTLKQRIGG